MYVRLLLFLIWKHLRVLPSGIKRKRKLKFNPICLGFINNAAFSTIIIGKRVPRIFQPHWMRANEDLAFEISNITADGWYQRVGDSFCEL